MDLDLPDEVVLALLAFFGLAFDAVTLAVDARLGLALDAPAFGDLPADFAGVFFAGDLLAGFLARAFCAVDFLVVFGANVFLAGVFAARLDFVVLAICFRGDVALVDAVDFLACVLAAVFLAETLEGVLRSLGLVVLAEAFVLDGVFLMGVLVVEVGVAAFADFISSSAAST